MNSELEAHWVLHVCIRWDIFIQEWALAWISNHSYHSQVDKEMGVRDLLMHHMILILLCCIKILRFMSEIVTI